MFSTLSRIRYDVIVADNVADIMHICMIVEQCISQCFN